MILKTVPEDKVDWTYSKIMFSGANAYLIIFYLLIGNNNERYLAEFKKICLCAIASIFIVITLNYVGLIDGTYNIIKSFCGLIFVITVSILISGVQHGYFKNKYENE